MDRTIERINPENETVTIGDGSDVTVKKYIKFKDDVSGRFFIIAGVIGHGRVDLYNNQSDVDTHFNDTESQLEDKLIEILNKK